MTDSLQKRLQCIGFSKNLSTVYLALHKLRFAKASDIIKETGLHRHIVYTELEKLVEKKLVSKLRQKNIQYFKMLKSERLLDAIEEQKRKAESLIEELHVHEEQHFQHIVIHEGKEEIQEAHLREYRSVPDHSNICIIGSSSTWYTVVGEEIRNAIFSEYRKRDLSMKIITPHIQETEEAFQADLNHRIAYRVLPGISADSTEIAILPHMVVIKIFIEPYTVIEIENPAIVRAYQQYFIQLWNIAQ